MGQYFSIDPSSSARVWLYLRMREQRRRQRFRIPLPLHIIQVAGNHVDRHPVLWDISSRGISFLSHQGDWKINDRIEYVITLSKKTNVRIRCHGRILRLKKTSLDLVYRYQLGATIGRYEFVRAEMVFANGVSSCPTRITVQDAAASNPELSKA